MSQPTLHHLLDDDRRQLDALYTVLQAERASLEKRDLDELNTLLQKKQALLGKIESNDQTRRQLLTKAGLPADQTSLTRLKELLMQNQDMVLVDLVTAIEHSLVQCRELSETNKIIVHRSKLNTRKALEILRGDNALTDLYNSHGDTKTGTVQRDLGNA